MPTEMLGLGQFGSLATIACMILTSAQSRS